MTTATVKAIEVHAYAPELNKIHLKNGAVLPAPGCTSVSEFRQRKRRAVPFKIMAELGTKYEDPEYSWLQRVETGWVPNRQAALVVAASWRKRFAGGPLHDGGFLPAPKITLRTWMVGA